MLELDRKNFEEEVLQAEGTVLVDFFGDGCVPCAALKPHVEALAEEYGDKIKFTCLNTSKARRLAISQKILGLPVVAIYQNGEKVTELVKEACTKEAVAELVKQYAE
ncbi:MAG: thioredoxin domain-containing protein [Eubacteriales bacterium]|nr:thioredoxin domain-containing protein [Eubacteriales bacterium]